VTQYHSIPSLRPLHVKLEVHHHQPLQKMADMSGAAVVHSWLTLLPLDLYSSRVLRSLEYPDLRSLYCTSKASKNSLQAEGPQFWTCLSVATVGASLTRLHISASKLLRKRISSEGSEDLANAKVCKKLLRKAARDPSCRPSSLRWDADATKKLYSSSETRELLRVCGHTATEVGSSIVVLGGSRLSPHRPSGATLINTRSLTCRAASLTPDSEIPMPRLRHAVTSISSSPEGCPRALVLGGVSEVFHHLEEMHSAAEALVLEIVGEEAGIIRWRSHKLHGPSPGNGSPLFHHVACSFNNGKQVVVWGGDTQDFSDGPGQEAAAAECNERKDFVFVLDVQTWTWNKIRTTGPSPPHRSVAEAVVFQEKLVVFGGSEDPKPPRAFVFGTLPSMKPMVLDLKTFEWQEVPPQPPSQPLPPPRTRFPRELRGSFVLVVGGRGQFGQSLDDAWRLDLRTMQWKEQRIRGSQVMPRNASAASALAGGLLLGGMTDGHPCVQAQALLWDVLEADPDNIDEDVEDSDMELEEEHGAKPSLGGPRDPSSNTTPTTHDSDSVAEASPDAAAAAGHSVQFHLPWLHALGHFLSERRANEGPSNPVSEDASVPEG